MDRILRCKYPERTGSQLVDYLVACFRALCIQYIITLLHGFLGTQVKRFWSCEQSGVQFLIFKLCGCSDNPGCPVHQESLIFPTQSPLSFSSAYDFVITFNNTTQPHKSQPCTPARAPITCFRFSLSIAL